MTALHVSQGTKESSECLSLDVIQTIRVNTESVTADKDQFWSQPGLNAILILMKASLQSASRYLAFL